MKKIILSGLLIAGITILSGCGSVANNTSSETSPISNQSILKSEDGGKTFSPKGKIDTNSSIGAANILSLAIDPLDGQKIYIGTESKGLYLSNNGGETWKKLDFPLTKIYSLSLAEGDVVYAGGLYKDRGKIYRSENGGEKWEEVYSEAENGPTISSIKVSKSNPQKVYAGVQSGAIIKTEDGGATWSNIYKASAPIINISLDAQNSEVVYFGIYNQGVIRTMDGGKTTEEITKNIQSGMASGRNVYALEADPSQSGVIYIGTDKGIVRGLDYGNKFESVDVLESAKNQPVRGLAVNPYNPNEIIFSSAQAVYKSVDGGKQWAVYQLEGSSYVQVMKYDFANPINIFLGLRK
jgi:photosystem II stability/assembly factor-like uncharacterized protein